MPSPLDPATVVRIARERRPEIAAARARALAASQQPKIVSALPDPMVSVSADYLPFSLKGVDGSLTVQQDFPLSGIRGNRERAAEAEADRLRSGVRRVSLDAVLDALAAYFMVGERRGVASVLDEQIGIVHQLSSLARARLASGQGVQADVLRLDNERARLESDRSALAAEIRSAEAMLDTALARSPDAAVPPLSWNDDLREPPSIAALVRDGLSRRPELDSARAERARALADVDVMKSMYAPMASVRVGPAWDMVEGAGITAMVGVTVPIWREKLSAGVSQAQSMVRVAGSEIDAMQRMIAGSIVSAREAVVAERTRLLALRREILPRARLVVESAIGSFGAGQGPMVSVLDAARDLRDVQMQELMVRARLGLAWAKLKRETGQLG